MAITTDNEWKKEYKHRIKCNRKILMIGWNPSVILIGSKGRKCPLRKEGLNILQEIIDYSMVYPEDFNESLHFIKQEDVLIAHPPVLSKKG